MWPVIKKQTDVIVQGFLIALQGQRIFSPLVQHLLGQLPLAVHGIGRHHHAGQGQHFQELGHCGNFVGLAVDGQLGQDQPLLCRPSSTLRKIQEK